jgi:hypothetical protein
MCAAYVRDAEFKLFGAEMEKTRDEKRMLKLK